MNLDIFDGNDIDFEVALLDCRTGVEPIIWFPAAARRAVERFSAWLDSEDVVWFSELAQSAAPLTITNGGRERFIVRHLFDATGVVMVLSLDVSGRDEASAAELRSKMECALNKLTYCLNDTSGKGFAECIEVLSYLLGCGVSFEWQGEDVPMSDVPVCLAAFVVSQMMLICRRYGKVRQLDVKMDASGDKFEMRFGFASCAPLSFSDGMVRMRVFEDREEQLPDECGGAMGLDSRNFDVHATVKVERTDKAYLDIKHPFDFEWLPD